jgi:hypothetical protein
MFAYAESNEQTVRKDEADEMKGDGKPCSRAGAKEIEELDKAVKCGIADSHSRPSQHRSGQRLPTVTALMPA